jgi:hypothetical protein
MSSLFDSLSEELFQVLKGSGKTLTLYGDDGNKTYEPKSARRVFATPDNLMVSVIEAGSDSEVKLYLSQSTDVKAISKLINTLRQITTRYNVLFNVRKYGRELQPKDFAYQASMNEANMWGSTKTSYQKFGPTKLIVRHCRPVVEGVIGARGRNILGLFVETKEGERFKFSENHLSAGRAFAQHINQGGRPHDDIGNKISVLAQESLNLAQVSRYIHHTRNLLGEEALSLRTPIKNRIVELRKAFITMSRPRGYHKIKESLPLNTVNLHESVGDRISHLQDILMIDSNHALAESLMPVALLQMGENMTNMNKMFHGVLTLEDAAADALVEALLDEYGHNDESWTRFGSSIAFNESEIFEDATGFLDLVESAYQINESDAVMDYATAWTKSRHAASGQLDDAGRPAQMDKDQEKGISELADGLRAILAGNFEIPEFPEHVPGFADGNAKARFYLDLYVGQHALANSATLNYVGTIIDKMAEGKKLDGAEKTVASKLIQTLEDDLSAGEVEESYYSPNPYDGDGNESDIEDMVSSYEEDFDGKAFLERGGYEEFIDPTMSDEDKVEPMDPQYFIKGIAHEINQELENQDITGYADSSFLMNAATEIFEKAVKPILIQHGWNLSEAVREFAEMGEEPESHGFEAGDHVATDMGPAVIISVDGDIASIEFLNGGARQMHVDDMDKVPALASFGEEAELAEWFEGFAPEAVLEVNFELPVKDKAAPVNPEFDAELKVGDRVTHKVYGAGEVTALNDKMAKVTFDAPHARLPDTKTVTMTKGVLTKAGAYRVEPEKPKLLRAGMEKIRNEGISKALGQIRGQDMNEAAFEPGRFEAIIDELKAFADKVMADPEKFGIELPVGVDDRNEQEMNFLNSLSQVLSGFIKDKISDMSYEGGMTFEAAGEEVLGGDQGEDLINDTKKHGSDAEYADQMEKNRSDREYADKFGVDEAASDVFSGYSDEMLKNKLKLASNDPKYAGYCEHLRSELKRRGITMTESDVFKEQLAELLKNANFRK